MGIAIQWALIFYSGIAGMYLFDLTITYPMYRSVEFEIEERILNILPSLRYLHPHLLKSHSILCAPDVLAGGASNDALIAGVVSAATFLILLLFIVVVIVFILRSKAKSKDM